MKGLFSQGVAVLLSHRPAQQELLAALGAGFGPQQASDDPWLGQDVLAMPGPGGRGQVQVDVLDVPWPDHMGDPDEEFRLFAAWSIGAFGPFAYPGGLERAVQQARLLPDAAEVVGRHRAVLRLRISYRPGAADNDPIVPPDYDPVSELMWLLPHWRRALSLKSALCGFAPSGELLCAPDQLDRAIDHAAQTGVAPIDIWTDVQMWRHDDSWLVMSTVGMEQIDVLDHEALVPNNVDPNQVAAFLRDISWYAVSTGADIKDGDTTDGPGGRWRCRHAEQAVMGRPRPTLRWVPVSSPEAPAALVQQGPEGPAREKPRKWRRRR